MVHFLTCSDRQTATFHCPHRQPFVVNVSQTILLSGGYPVICAKDLLSSFVSCTNSPLKCSKVLFIASGVSNRCAINGTNRPLLSTFKAFTEFGPITYNGGADMLVAQMVGDSAPVKGDEEPDERPGPFLFQTRLLLGMKPRKNQKYTLFLDGAEEAALGKTDGDGLTEEHEVSIGCSGAHLAFGWGEELTRESEIIDFEFQALPPVDTPQGQLTRLRNLGFEPERRDDEKSLGTLLAEFAQTIGLAKDRPEAEILNRLKDSYGC